LVSQQILLDIHNLLSLSVKKRFENIPFNDKFQQPTVLVMFSGGLDSTILAALLCDLLPENVCLDLVNVSFSGDGTTSPDRITSIISYS